MYAGSVLSGSRLQPGNWAGAAKCWGLENREAAVRFIAATKGNPRGANAELKIIDPSANPYLAATALLGSALRGIEKALELPRRSARQPIGVKRRTPPLPTDQRAVIEALETSAIAAELLTPAVVEGLVAVRRHETHHIRRPAPAETTQALRLAWSC